MRFSADWNSGAGFLARLFTRRNVERLIMPECASAMQHDELIMRRAFVSQILRQRAPPAACRQQIEDGVQNIMQADMSLAPSVLRGRDKGLGQIPFIAEVITKTKPLEKRSCVAQRST